MISLLSQHLSWLFRVNLHRQNAPIAAYHASAVSLIEMLIYVSLFSIIGIAVMSIHGMVSGSSAALRQSPDHGLTDASVSARLAVRIPPANRPEFCQFIADPVLPARFGQNISEAWVQITPASLEADRDWLGFAEYGNRTTISTSQNDIPTTLIRYHDISINSAIIWPQIIAEYNPANGIMHICAANTGGCANRIQTPRFYTQWRKAISQLVYLSSTPSGEASKVIIFSAGVAPSCPDPSPNSNFLPEPENPELENIELENIELNTGQADNHCGITIENSTISPPPDQAAMAFNPDHWMVMCRLTVSIP